MISIYSKFNRGKLIDKASFPAQRNLRSHTDKIRW